MLRRQNICTHALKDNFHRYNFHVFWQPGHNINYLNLCNFSTPWRKRALTSPSTPHPQTEAQCKCGQNSYPQLAHINKSFSAVERSSFSNFFFILTKEMWPRDIYWQFVFFSGTAQIEHVMVAIGKSGLGKTRMGGRGDMLLLLVTIGEPSIAGYLRVWRRRYRRTTPGHRTPTTYRATWR